MLESRRRQSRLAKSAVARPGASANSGNIAKGRGIALTDRSKLMSPSSPMSK